MAYTKKGFVPSLQRNYDKILFAAALLFLVGTGAFFAGSGKRIAEERDAFEAQVRRLSPDHPTLAEVDTSPVEAASKRFAEPFQMGTNRLFLVAQERVRCVNPGCRHPIPWDSEKCSFCGADQPAEGKVAGGDSDSDGMPDEFEERYAFLNPVDPTDANADYDGDGFTNLEEFQAGTDPSVAASHPSKVEFLRVSDVVEDTIPLRLMGSSRLSAEKVRYQIKGPTRDWNVLPGEPIDDPTGGSAKFTIVSAGVVTNMVVKQGYSEKRPEEVPVVTISNGLVRYRLEQGTGRGSSGEFRVTFICTKDTDGKEYLGLPGQPFSFDGAEFVVLKVDRQHGSVLIRRVSDKKEFNVPKR